MYHRSRPVQYQPSCGTTCPALRLILDWLLASIHGLVLHPRLVLYIYNDTLILCDDFLFIFLFELQLCFKQGNVKCKLIARQGV